MIRKHGRERSIFNDENRQKALRKQFLKDSRNRQYEEGKYVLYEQVRIRVPKIHIW